MESGAIANDQISATNDEGNVNNARLNRGEFWSAGSGSTVEELGWIQVDLRQVKIVTGLATQVEEVNGEYSIDLCVEYSANTATILQTENGTKKVSVILKSYEGSFQIVSKFPLIKTRRRLSSENSL